MSLTIERPRCVANRVARPVRAGSVALALLIIVASSAASAADWPQVPGEWPGLDVFTRTPPPMARSTSQPARSPGEWPGLDVFARPAAPEQPGPYRPPEPRPPASGEWPGLDILTRPR